jgi:ribosomal protein S18 acetylase RimI-like enzyme
LNSRLGDQLPRVTIREAVPGDTTALAALARVTFETSFGKTNSVEDIRYYCDRAFSITRIHALIRDPQITVFIADALSDLVGYSTLRLNASRTDAELVRLYVMPGWQGQGVGSRLLRQTESAAFDSGVGRVWLAVWEQNEDAQRFYRARGFRSFATKQFELGSAVHLGVLMEKQLPGAKPVSEPRGS